MRIWDIDPTLLCRKHLLGEHRELHAIWSVLTKGKEGYSHHPETKRWVGKLESLYQRHESLVAEMKNRGYNHHSPLDRRLAAGHKDKQDELVNTIAEQHDILKGKDCLCFSDVL